MADEEFEASTTVTRAMLTTIDNPHSPFDNFKEWFVWDTTHGYHSTALLGRLTFTSDELSESDYALAIEQAIDDIVELNPSGMFRKVTRQVPKQVT